MLASNRDMVGCFEWISGVSRRVVAPKGGADKHEPSQRDGGGFVDGQNDVSPSMSSLQHAT